VIYNNKINIYYHGGIMGQYYYQQPPQQQPPYYPPAPTRTSTWAIISMVGGILGWLGLFGLGGLVGIICGHVAQSEIKKSAGTITGNGMAVAGLILGYLNVIGTIVAVILAIILPLLGVAICGGAGALGGIIDSGY
jgi:hypothetical protein